MSTSKHNFYHNKKKDPKRNKSAHEEIQIEAVDSNSLFKFEFREPETRIPATARGQFMNQQSRQPDKLVQVMGDTFDAGNLSYINSLIRNQEIADERFVRQQKKHQRNKSDISEQTGYNSVSPRPSEQTTPTMYPQNSLLQKEEENAQLLRKYEKRTNSVDESASQKSATRYFDSSSIQQRLNSIKEIDSRGESAEKDVREKLFGEFFQQNNGPRTTPKQDLRQNFYSEKEQQHKVPTQDNQGDLNAEFMSNLDGYLNYFDNMERDAKSGQMAFKEFYSPHNDGHRQPKHETEAASEEVKNLRKMVEKLESKLNETILSKKKLNNELITLRTKEDAYKRRIRALEEEVASVLQKNKAYKTKLAYTQELLAKEKIENENNLIALKKVLSEKMEAQRDYASNQYYFGNHHHHPKRNKDTFENYLSENPGARKAGYTHDAYEKNVNLSRLEPKRPQHTKRLDEKNYDIDLNIENTDSVDDDTVQSQSNYEFDDSSDQSEFYLNKKSKNQQIQQLQEKLQELLETSEPFPKNTTPRIVSTRSKSKTNNRQKQDMKDYASKGHDYYDLRDRQGSFSRVEKQQKHNSRYVIKPETKEEQTSSTYEARNNSFSLQNSD